MTEFVTLFFVTCAFLWILEYFWEINVVPVQDSFRVPTSYFVRRKSWSPNLTLSSHYDNIPTRLLRPEPISGIRPTAVIKHKVPEDSPQMKLKVGAALGVRFLGRLRLKWGIHSAWLVWKGKRYFWSKIGFRFSRLVWDGVKKIGFSGLKWSQDFKA